MNHLKCLYLQVYYSGLKSLRKENIFPKKDMEIMLKVGMIFADIYCEAGGTMNIKRIKIMFNINRHHITYEILKVLKLNDIPIISMEVYSNVIYLKLPFMTDELIKKVYDQWSKVQGFDHIEEIDVMSFEEKDVELESVLNFINEGVVMLNRTGTIEYINRIAHESFPDVEIGRYIYEYIDGDDVKNFFSSNKNSIKNKIIISDNTSYILNIDKIYSEEKIFCGYIASISTLDLSEYNAQSYITFDDIIGESPKLKEAIEMAKLFANSDSNILLLGESGTGKEMFARSIHSYSRPDKKFMGINCAAIPEELLESELFGYEPGTFTGGLEKGRIGIFEACSGGTVFLDEIAELNYHLQAKVLRAIQERKIRRLGSNREVNLDIRIISATNRDLKKLIEEDKFRLDLYYRLNTFSIEIPPLRERMDDLKILAKYFVSKMKNRYQKEEIKISNEAAELLKSYSWPGNIREFQNVLERAVVLAKDCNILAKHIMFDHKEEKFDSEIPDNLKEAVEEFEKNYIERVLNESESIREAARKMGATHTLLINRMKKYSLEKKGM